eukprot:6188889-Pleurochrysis_carterae.AAC.3
MRAARVLLDVEGRGMVGHLAMVSKVPQSKRLQAHFITKPNAEPRVLHEKMEGRTWSWADELEVRVSYLEDEDSDELTAYTGRIASVNENLLLMQVVFNGACCCCESHEWTRLRAVGVTALASRPFHPQAGMSDTPT